MTRIRSRAVVALLSVGVPLLTFPLRADDTGGNKARRVLVLSIDGMHALDLALWAKNNPGSAIGQLVAQGINYTNASTTKPSDSIPATAAIFSGGSPAVTGMYYDDAYNRSWFAPSDVNCTGPRGTVFSLKDDIDVDPTAANPVVDPAKSPKQLVNGVCTPVLPHNMMRVNTVFEVLRSRGMQTAYSEKRPAYDFLNGPSGTGIQDLYVPEIGSAILKNVAQTEAFDDLRVTSVLNELRGFDHTGTNQVGVPNILGMNFQAINAAKKDSLGGGYADDLGTPNATLAEALQHTDASIGQMISTLAAQGLSQTTAIILMAKHGESSLDPSLRFIVTTSAIQTILTAAGFPASVVPKITEKSSALIWLKNQSQTQAVANVLTLKANEQSLHVQQLITGESMKLLFPDPLVDPAPPDIILVPYNGTNYEPSTNPALPAVQAEHGGFNENETHVPLVVVVPSLTPGVNRAPVTLSQIAPTILSILGLDPNALDAVNLEGTRVLPLLPTKQNNGLGNN